MTHISVDIQRITLNASCMTISGGRTKQLDCRFSAASLALRVIFSSFIVLWNIFGSFTEPFTCISKAVYFEKLNCRHAEFLIKLSVNQCSRRKWKGTGTPSAKGAKIEAPRGVGSGQGVSLSPVGEGAVPRSHNFFGFLCLAMVHFGAFWALVLMLV